MDGCFPCGGVARHLAADNGSRWITEASKVKSHQQWRSLPIGSPERRGAEGNDHADQEAKAAIRQHGQQPPELLWEVSSMVKEATGILQLAAAVLPL